MSKVCFYGEDKCAIKLEISRDLQLCPKELKAVLEKLSQNLNLTGLCSLYQGELNFNKALVFTVKVLNRTEIYNRLRKLTFFDTDRLDKNLWACLSKPLTYSLLRNTTFALESIVFEKAESGSLVFIKNLCDVLKLEMRSKTRINIELRNHQGEFKAANRERLAVRLVLYKYARKCYQMNAVPGLTVSGSAPSRMSSTEVNLNFSTAHFSKQRYKKMLGKDYGKRDQLRFWACPPVDVSYNPYWNLL